MKKQPKEGQYRYDSAYGTLYEWDPEAEAYVICFQQYDHDRNTKQKSINDLNLIRTPLV